MDLYDKWINDYIDNIDLSKIEWVKFDYQQLMDFYDDNYLDKDNWQYVHGKRNNSYMVLPLGLRYLSFNSNNCNCNFLLGLVNNNIGKKTIVAAMVYFENYYFFEQQFVPLTYISTIEVNSYFWNKGIFNKLCDQVVKFINLDQHILVSEETDMGRKCNVIQKLRNVLLNHDFEQEVFIDDYYKYKDVDFYTKVCSRKRIL